MVRQTIKISGIDGIALTKLDVLDELDEIKMCIEYDKQEWNRIKKTIKKIDKKIPLSLDTRKSEIMEKGIFNIFNPLSRSFPTRKYFIDRFYF